MKKAFTIIELLIVLIVIFLITCIFFGSLPRESRVKVIDNCQYMETWNGREWNLTHKGSCTNKIHILN
jgi:hypothetical protein